MKILLVIPTVYGGGAEQVAAVLAREWAAAHDLRVLAWHVGAQQLDFGVAIEDLRLPAQAGLLGKLRMFVARVAAVRRTRLEYQPEVVLAFMDEAGLVCSAAACLDGWLGRLMVSMHHNPLWLGRLRRALLAWVYRFPAAVVGVSQGVCAEMARSMRLPAARLQQIPNPLELSGESQTESPLLPFAEGFVLFVGRLDRHTKGLDTLLAAYALLPAGRPALVMVGDGPDQPWLMSEIARLESRGVQCLGWQTDVRPFYRRAGMLVVSSRFEGWSNVLMEAMGCACPVLATDCPYGPAEILGPDFVEQLSPVEDAPALAANMLRVMAMPESERVALGAALCERVQQFAAPRVAARWIELARSLPGVKA